MQNVEPEKPRIAKRKIGKLCILKIINNLEKVKLYYGKSA
jgi:hypothetical protein